MHEELGLRKLSGNIAGTLGRQIGAGLLQLATVVVIARVYGPEGNGAYTVSLFLPAILASLLNMGIAPANVYYLGSGQVTPRIAWKKSLKLYAIISAVGMVIGSAVLQFYSWQWFPGIPKILLWIALATFPVLFILALISSIFQGLQLFKQFNFILLIQPFLTLLVVLFLVITGVREIAWLLGAYLLSSLVTLYFALKALKPLLAQYNAPKFSGYGSAVLRYGYKAHLGNMLAFINYKIDVFLVNLFLGPAETGVYVIAVQLAERLWLLSQAVSTVLLPRLAELTSDEQKRRTLTPLVSRWVLLTTLLGALLLGVIGYPVINLLFGRAFFGAVKPLWTLLPGIVILSSTRILANDIAARGHPEVNMYISLIVVFVNIIGNLVLIPIYGIVGAAISTSIAYSITFLLILTVYNHFTGVAIFNNMLIKKEDFRLIRSLLISFTRSKTNLV